MAFVVAALGVVATVDRRHLVHRMVDGTGTSIGAVLAYLVPQFALMDVGVGVPQSCCNSLAGWAWACLLRAGLPTVCMSTWSVAGHAPWLFACSAPCHASWGLNCWLACQRGEHALARYAGALTLQGSIGKELV
jgi:hypothetical protein